jgi:HEAT repeat protein
MRTKLIGSLVGLLLVGRLPAAGTYDEVIDSPMYKVPDTPRPRTDCVFPAGLTQLWRRAFERPGAEAEIRCRLAHAVVRAKQLGVEDLDIFLPPFRGAIDQPDQHPTVRLAVARALVVLDARDAAPSLLRIAREGDVAMRNVIEPALARWNFQPARQVWLERLGDPATPPWSLVLAIRGLAAVGEVKAADRLRAIVLSGSSGQLRVEAARALGALRSEGLEADAERLAADASPTALIARLAAASLLQRHQSQKAIDLLQRLTRDKEPSVVRVAVTRLLALDAKLVLPALDAVLASRDAKVRSLGVDVLFRLPDQKHLPLLADRLDDQHPEVRRQTRRFLHALAGNKELQKQVIAEATRVLAGDEWRGQEQATILLTQLNHKPATRRFVKLLRSERPEVLLTAAWGLRKLAEKETLLGAVAGAAGARGLRKLADKETLDGVVKYIQDEAPPLLAGPGAKKRVPLEVLDHQLSQLNQLLGEQKHAGADDLLRRFIPRPFNESGGAESRAAAVWALGLIHEGKTDRELAAQLEGRLNAGNAIPAEFPHVRRMSAITLARLGAREALPSLRRHRPDRKPSAGDLVKNACGWAIEQLDGEAMLAPETLEAPQGDWFLKPSQ